MKIKIIFVLLVSSGIISGQSDTSQTFYLDDFKIECFRKVDEEGISKKSKFVYKNLNTVRIVNDIFSFSAGNLDTVKFTGREIRKISIKDGNYMLPGAGFSAAGGFAMGFLLGSIAKGKGSGHPSYSFEGPEFGLALGLLLGLSAGIVGGIFGAITPYYEDFELGKNGLDNNNSQELKSIINRFKD